MKKSLQAGLRFVPMLMVMGTIFYLSDQPDLPVVGFIFPFADKLAHISIYAILAATILFGFPASYRAKHPVSVCCITLAVCAAYGISDEFHQSFVPGRMVSGADLLADVIGSCVILLVWTRRQHRLGKDRFMASRV